VLEEKSKREGGWREGGAGGRGGGAGKSEKRGSRRLLRHHPSQ